MASTTLIRIARNEGTAEDKAELLRAAVKLQTVVPASPDTLTPCQLLCFILSNLTKAPAGVTIESFQDRFGQYPPEKQRDILIVVAGHPFDDIGAQGGGDFSKADAEYKCCAEQHTNHQDSIIHWPWEKVVAHRRELQRAVDAVLARNGFLPLDQPAPTPIRRAGSN